MYDTGYKLYIHVCTYTEYEHMIRMHIKVFAVALV